MTDRTDPRSTPSRSKWWAWAQLVRLPMVPTALADPFAGWWVAGQVIPTASLVTVIGASVCLYVAGMLWNDWADYEEDCRQRPERPLPRGDISRRAVAVAGAACTTAGVVLGWLANPWAGLIATSLAGTIFLYDFLAKRHVVFGPVAMGGCRALNFMLSWGGPVGFIWWMPAVLGAYVAGVTVLAAEEAKNPHRRGQVGWWLRGIVVVDAILIATTGNHGAAMGLLALLVPALLLSRWWSST